MPHQKLQKILISHFFKYSLIPIFVVEVMLLVLYFSINSYISSKNTDMLLDKAQSYTQEVLKNESRFISNKLNEVSRLAKVLQYEHQEIMKNSKNFGLPNGKPSFAVAQNGVFYKTNKIGSSLYYSSNTKIGEKEIAKATFTEAMDVSLKSIVDTNPIVMAAYFNSPDDMNRLYPFIDDVAKQYGKHINMEDYNFYYLADLKHNPKKEPVWTGAYLDPAGNGWMLSCIVPIYNGDVLEGVTGIDITIDNFVKNILNTKLPYNANLFMVDKDGMIIAMSEYIESLLGLKELKEHLYTDAILKTIEKPEEFNIFKNSTPFASNFKELIEGEEHTSSFKINGNKYLALEQNVAETDWELLILIDENEIFDSIVYLKNLSDKIGYFAIAFLLLFYVVFFYFLLRRINFFSGAITKPIVELSEETTKVKETDTKISTIKTDILEIYQLNTNFSNMIQELNKKTQNLNAAKLLAEESSKAKDDFLANMSHELKTPLNSVNLISSIMLKNRKGNLDEKDIKSLGIINNSGRDLLNLIEDVLDISKLESGEEKLNNQDFKVCELVERICKSFKAQMENKNLKFTYECNKDIGLVHSDQDKIKQVLKNLLSNALKFTFEGEVKLTVKLDQEFIEISVKDTGVGIPEEKLENVFDRFKQVDSSITRKFGGTGLGLSITKEITNLLGGDIKVNSQLNKGSIFTARIKSNKEEVSKKDLIDDSASLDENKKDIILFNNDPIKFISLSVFLQKSTNLTTTGSFEELLSISSSKEFDNIIIDATKIDFEDLCKLLVFKEKVIVIYDNDLGNVDKIKEAFLHTFKKPFDALDIISVINS